MPNTGKLILAVQDAVAELLYINDTFFALENALSTGDEPLKPYALYLPCIQLNEIAQKLHRTSEALDELKKGAAK